jgi:hypothetical protein
MIAPEPRTYRFAPLDRSGWLLGLQAPQCVLLGAGLVAGTLLLQLDVSPLAALGAIASAAGLAFAPAAGGRAYEWLPVLAKYFMQPRSWRRPITRASTRGQTSWPPLLDGMDIIDLGTVRLTHGPVSVGAIEDGRTRTLSSTVRVRGRGFSLVERGEQERLVALWGDVLAGFCGERSEVVSARVTEWSAPADLEVHERFFTEHGSSTVKAAAEDYRALLGAARPRTVSHEALVTVTVDLRRLRSKSKRGAAHALEDAARDHVRSLVTRLDAAGLDAAPLDRDDLAATLRARLDPAAAADGRRTSWRSLAAAVGASVNGVAAPMATEATWSSCRVDGSWHRAFWVADWPRLDVGPSWFEGLMLHAGGTRTVSLNFEPVAPSRSRRRIDRDSTRLASDEEQRSRTGFRIGAAHRRAQAAVAEREAELVAGYAELDFTGFILVSAGDEDELARNAGDFEQVAAQSGLHIRPLDARHDLGLLCTLPHGRGLVARRSA